MHRSPKNASVRAALPRPGRRPPGGRPSGRRSGRPRRPAGSRARRPPSPPRPSRGRGAAPAGRTRRRGAGCRRGRSPTRPAGRRSTPAERPASRRRGGGRRRGRSGGGSSRRRRRRPGRSRPSPARARSASPRRPASSRTLSLTRSPIPVSTRTRPAGVSTAGSSAPGGGGARGRSRRSTSEFHRIRGTGPNSAPASERNVPAWISATRDAAAEVQRPVDRVVRSAHRSAIARRGAQPAGFLPLREVAVERGRRRLRLALVLRSELLRAVRPIDRARHLEERDLADLHPEIERDRQVRDVRQLERQVALPARVDVARGRVDQQPESAQRALALRAWPRDRPAARPIPASGRGRTRPGGG